MNAEVRGWADVSDEVSIDADSNGDVGGAVQEQDLGLVQQDSESKAQDLQDPFEAINNAPIDNKSAFDDL